MKNIEKEIEEIKEKLKEKLEEFNTRKLEVDYIKSYIELMKIQAIIIAIKEQGRKEKI